MRIRVIRGQKNPASGGGGEFAEDEAEGEGPAEAASVGAGLARGAAHRDERGGAADACGRGAGHLGFFGQRPHEREGAVTGG